MSSKKKIRTFGPFRSQHADQLCHELARRFFMPFVVLQHSDNVCSIQTREPVDASFAIRLAIQSYIDGFTAGFAASQESLPASSKEKLICSNNCNW